MKDYKITEQELNNLLYILNAVIEKHYKAEFIRDTGILLIKGFYGNRTIQFEEIKK